MQKPTLGLIAGSLLLATACGKTNLVQHVVDAEATVEAAFNAAQQKDPTRATQLLASCTGQPGSNGDRIVQTCVMDHWDQPNSTGATQVSQEAYQYAQANAALVRAWADLQASNPPRMEHLRAACRAEVPGHEDACILDRWTE